MKRLLGALLALLLWTNLALAQGTILSGNSSTTVLGNGGVFTGEPVPILNASSVTVAVFADQASATNGLSIQQSPDGTNWDILDTFTIPAMAAGQGMTIGVQATAQYLRVVYTNGSTPQTAFRLQTILKTGMQRASSVRPQDSRSNEIDTMETLGYGMLYNGSTWDRAFTCNQSAVVNVAAAATTQLVALTASQVIRVCSFVLTGDTAATTATFVYGTGTNCGTGQAALTGAMRMVDEGNLVLSAGAGTSLFRTIASNALCLTAATGAVTGFVTYAKY